MKTFAALTNGLVKLIGVFLLLFSIISVIQGMYSLRVSFNQGRFGFEYDADTKDGYMVIQKVFPDSASEEAGMKIGDKIKAVNGNPVKGLDIRAAFANAIAGSDITLTMDREGQIITITMTRKLLPVMMRLTNVLYHIFAPLLMLAYVLVGMWGLYRRASFVTSLIALVCFFMGGLIAMVDFSAYQTVVITVFTRHLYYFQIRGGIQVVSMALAPAFWLYLFINFPQKASFYLKHKILTILAIFLTPALIAAVRFTMVPEIFGYQIFNLAYGLYVFIFVFWGIAILSKGAKQVESVLKRRQYHMMLWGIKTGAHAIGIGFGTLILYGLLMKDWPPFFGWLVFFLFLISQLVGLVLPFTFLNSFMRNKILETESALRRKLRFLAASFALFAIYLGIAFLMGKWIIQGLALTDNSLIILIILVLSLTFAPLHSRLLRWLEEKLYPEKTKYKSALKEMVKRLPAYIEESQILENLALWLSETMGIQPIYAVSIDRTGGGAMKIPLKRNSERSVLAKTKDGSSFFWDEIAEESGVIIDEEERSWALNKGISITVPMISGGEQVGVLSIGKKKNQEDFTGDDLEIFQEAAYHTALALQNVKMQMEHLEKKRLDKELEVAREIQNRLVPQQIPDVKGLELHGYYQPCFEVGGDYFDIIPVDEHRSVLVVADVSGKGAGAALLMSNLQASLRMAIAVSLPLDEMVYKINNLICGNSLNTQFITFFIGMWNNSDGTLGYINAGHNPPLVFGEGEKPDRLSPTGIGLGIKPHQQHETKTISLNSGDVLAIYTDGIEEYFNYRQEIFGMNRMISAIRDSRQGSPKEIVEHLFQRLKAFSEGKEAAYCDDLTIIVAKKA